MGTLDALRARLQGAPPGPEGAALAVEVAEHEPLLAHRADAVRAALDAAAARLDDLALPEPDGGALRARVMLRLAEVAMARGDWEGADQALAAVGAHAPADRAARFLAGARACRVALRRGRRAEAERTLRLAATALPEEAAAAPGAAPWRAATVEIILGIAELAVEGAAPPPGALEPLRELLAELDGDPALGARFVDARVHGRQLLAAAALAAGDPGAACAELRATIGLAAGSPADECEARLALAAALAARGDLPGREEATRHVQLARDRALEHGLREHLLAAQLAQAGVLASRGRTAGAVDRVLEVARDGAARGDVGQYVAAVGIMAELYARTGDHASALRTIGEARHALARATGQDVTPLFRPHLARLRDRIGPERLDALAADVARATRLAGELAEGDGDLP